MSDRPTEALRKYLNSSNGPWHPSYGVILGHCNALDTALRERDARIAELEDGVRYAERQAGREMIARQDAPELALAGIQIDGLYARIFSLERLIARMLPWFGGEAHGDEVEKYEAVLEEASTVVTASISKETPDV